MSFTRFDYDECRTAKKLQELTGSGRYMLNTPGPGCNLCFYEDPQIRLQGWGANLRHVSGGAPIDIDSDLLGITRKLTKDCTKEQYPYKGVVNSERIHYPKCAQTITQQSRATNPAWMYRDLEQNHRYPLFLNPQENTCIPFHNNLNTRLLERDNFRPTYPCASK
jgi:hypothetical protein